MGAGVLVSILAFIAANAAASSDFPVQNADQAIAIAKRVCSDKADPALQWHASLNTSTQVWDADTEPSLHKSGDPLWVVFIPVDGPFPTECGQAMYDR